MADWLLIVAGRTAQVVGGMCGYMGDAFDKMHGVIVALEHAAEGVQGKLAPTPAKRSPAAPVSAEPAAAQPVLPLRELLWTSSASLSALAGQLVMVSFPVCFLLASGQALEHKWVRVVGNTLSEKKHTVRMMAVVGTQIQYSLLALFTTNITLGVLITVAFVLLGMEDAAVWGLATAVPHFVPYLGPVVIIVASGIDAHLQMGTWSGALVMAGVTLLPVTLVGTLLVTWLQNRTPKLDPCMVYIGSPLWGWLWDLWGLLLGMSITVMTKVVCDHVDQLRLLGMLLGVTDASAGVSQRLLDRLRGRSTWRLECVHRPR